jgi:hypothetical protein
VHVVGHDGAAVRPAPGHGEVVAADVARASRRLQSLQATCAAQPRAARPGSGTAARRLSSSAACQSALCCVRKADQSAGTAS